VKFRFQKKGQHALIFTVILAIIVVGFIIVFGISSFNKLRASAEQATMIEFQEEIKGSAKTVYSQYDTVRKLELMLPGKYDTICFVDMYYFASSADYTDIDDNRIRGSVEDGVEANTFLLGPKNAFMPLYLGGDKSYVRNNNEPYKCIESADGYLTLRMQGLGNGVTIEKWPTN